MKVIFNNPLPEMISQLPFLTLINLFMRLILVKILEMAALR